MKKGSLYLLPVISFLFYNCSTSDKESVLLTAPLIEPDRLTLVNIPLNNEVQYDYQSGYVILNNNGEEEYWGLDAVNSSINIFNLAKKDLSKRILIPKTGPSAVTDILNFHVHTADSIFLLTANTGSIFLIDANAEIINKWNYQKLTLPTGESLSENFPFPMAEFGMHFFYQEEKAYLTLPLWLRGTGEFYQVPPLIHLDLNDNRVANSFGVYPENYKGKEKSIRDHINQVKLKTGEILVSFQESHHIQKYSSEGELLMDIPAKSNFVDEFTLFEEYPDRETSRIYWVENGFYTGLLYDPYKDLIYRIVCHGQPLKDLDGNLNNPLMANWSIIILRPDGELIGEIELEGSKYRFNDGIYVSKDGILASLENINNKYNIEESLEFELINFNLK